MKRGIVIAAIVLVLSACGHSSSNKPIGIYNSGHSVAYCATIDAEKRIAYDCDFLIGHVDEYHLSVTDSWSRIGK